MPLNRSSHCYFGDSHICIVFKNYFISSEQSWNELSCMGSQATFWRCANSSWPSVKTLGGELDTTLKTCGLCGLCPAGDLCYNCEQSYYCFSMDSQSFYRLVCPCSVSFIELTNKIVRHIKYTSWWFDICIHRETIPAI